MPRTPRSATPWQERGKHHSRRGSSRTGPEKGSQDMRKTRQEEIKVPRAPGQRPSALYGRARVRRASQRARADVRRGPPPPRELVWVSRGPAPGHWASVGTWWFRGWRGDLAPSSPRPTLLLLLPRWPWLGAFDGARTSRLPVAQLSSSRAVRAANGSVGRLSRAPKPALSARTAEPGSTRSCIPCTAARPSLRAPS